MASHCAVQAACEHITPSLVLTDSTPVPHASQALQHLPPKQTACSNTNQLLQGLLPLAKQMLASVLQLVLEEAGTFLHPKHTWFTTNQGTAEDWYMAQKMPC